MSLRDYLKAFHRAVGRIDDYGFAESIDIKEERRAAKQAIINRKSFSLMVLFCMSKNLSMPNIRLKKFITPINTRIGMEN